MSKCTQLFPFVQDLLDDPSLAWKGTRIIAGLLKGRSPRLSDISRAMPGNADANYKCIQRFLDECDLEALLLRMYREDAPFVIGDPTEMPRPQARRTEYVGTLTDGETLGYWLLLLATPYQGRVIPCGFVDYSSRTINQDATSRNRHHLAAIAKLKDLIGAKPLVLDREFSYLELLENLVQAGIHFVIRLKVGPKFCDEAGKPVLLSVQKGETRILPKVFYKGQVFVNVVGRWKDGFSEPMWVMTDLKAEEGLEIYLQRMKIEQAFRDLKSLLHFDKLMNKCRHWMEKMVALVLLAYTLALFLGEVLREHEFPQGTRKHRLYSGPFIFLKLKTTFSSSLLSKARQVFLQLLLPVRTHV